MLHAKDAQSWTHTHENHKLTNCDRELAVSNDVTALLPVRTTPSGWNTMVLMALWVTPHPTPLPVPRPADEQAPSKEPHVGAIGKKKKKKLVDANAKPWQMWFAQVTDASAIVYSDVLLLCIVNHRASWPTWSKAPTISWNHGDPGYTPSALS